MDKNKLITALKSGSEMLILSSLQEESDVQFMQTKSMNFGYCSYPISLLSLSIALLESTNILSPEQVVDNLDEFCNRNDIPGIEVLAISGLEINDTIEFSNGIKLMPYKELPNFSLKAIYDETSVPENYVPCGVPHELFTRREPEFLKQMRGERNIKPTAALTCQAISRPKFYQKDHASSTRYEDLMEACACLTLVGPCSVAPMVLWWQPTVWVPQIHSTFGSIPLGIDLTNQSIFYVESFDIKQKIIEIHDSFLKFSPKQRKKLTISLDRLGRSIRRIELVDKAIELGIAMEAIFLERGNELNYRLQLRAAWLLGTDLPQRKEIMNLFKELYKLRSYAVHEGIIPEKYLNSQVGNSLIQKGIQYVSNAIEAIIRKKELPNEDYWNYLILGSETHNYETLT